MGLTTRVAEKLPGYYEIALTGRLDTETHAELEKVGKGLLAKSARGLRLDMAGLSYISSMGLRVVLQLAKVLREKKGAFQVTNMQPQIKKVFDIAATLPTETIFASVAEADAYFDAMQKKAMGKGDDLED
jgi:anti-anti-sigma factor